MAWRPSLAEYDGNIDPLESDDLGDAFDELMRHELALANSVPFVPVEELTFSELTMSTAKRDELGW